MTNQPTTPMTEFPKQPITRIGVTSVPTSVDSDGGLSDTLSDHAPVSLLSTLIHNQHPSSHPSPPSTAMSSPSGRIEPTPILRRDSICVSDAEPLPGLAMAMTGSGSSALPSRKCALKFAVASHPTHPHPPLVQPETALSDSEGSDAGYQEDEEDGAFSSDDDNEYPSHIPPPPKYPFARPTNYHNNATSSSPPPAPAVLPPPPRRGRGHVRVNDPTPAPKSCSRHCSPPPSRSGSNSRRGSHVSDAGPRNGRAGSPMPDVSGLESEDDSDIEEPSVSRPVNAINNSAESSSSAAMEPSSSVGEGVRGFLRRASEHIPGFRRSSGAHTPREESALETSDQEGKVNGPSSSNLIRARSLGAKVTFNPNLPIRDPRRVVSQAVSADEARRPRPVQCAPRQRKDEMAWSDEAVF